MVSIGALEQLTEPGTLRSCIARKVEYDGDALRQESTHVWPKRVFQSGRALDESRHIGDLAGKKVIQELVLKKINFAETLIPYTPSAQPKPFTSHDDPCAISSLEYERTRMAADSKFAS
jgi:hypothetical protein